MTTRILITDDSALARKQMARSLPEWLDADIEFAENGLIAIEKLKSSRFDLMFLDLTMPELDGYGTLEQMRSFDLSVPVFVVSGDIQPKAQERVLALGAKHFIKKPVAKDVLSDLLKEYVSPSQSSGKVAEKKPVAVDDVRIRRRDIYMEVVNVAMGRAADSLARFFDVFVELPLPQVNVFETGELIMTIRHLASNSDSMSGVCQGFSGEGIGGEALMLLSDSNISDLLKVLNYPDTGAEDNELELLMDVSNVLTSAFLMGLGEQAGVKFAQTSPTLLGQHVDVNSLVETMKGNWKKTVTIEVSYGIEGTNIKCDLLLLLVDESLPLLDNKLAYLMDED
ncbi:response regulator [Parasalinivibrio latis]|uniref:response regulator n=1 Tax=Parasalinivibrio latis TaxID=2952610 RepID=UPI0030DED4AB